MLTQVFHFFSPLGEPIGVLWLLHLVAGIILIKKRQWRAARFPLLLAAVIWVCGGTPLPARLLASLERPYTRVKWSEVPACDAVVMLGGGHRPSQFDPLGFELTPSADRITTAWWLARSNKCKALVFGGGGRRVDGVEVV